MSLLTQTPGPQAHTHSAETFVPDQSRAERTQSFDVADFPLPSGREEEWRFTPVGDLGALFADERTGACLDGAGSDPVDLRTWPVAVVDGEVWIEPSGDEVTGSPFDRGVT